MMTAQHHRRRSLEAARRRRNERRTSGEQLQDQQTPIPSVRDQASPEPAFSRSRASSSSLSASSSTSSSLVNVSRPSKFSFGAFFSGSGRKHHHRVKKKRSNRLSRYGNSSSSSVNSDLAYGRGYVDRRRSRELASRDGDGFGMAASPPPLQTDAEIVELGRKFAELARKQNTEDLRAAGRSRPSALVGAATALSQFHRTNSGKSRGVGSSKPRRDSSPEDSEWESASDDDSSSEEFDSGLAYGSGASLPSAAEKPTRLQRPRIQSPGTSESQTPLHRKRSFVDPNLFGPVNSLRGYVDAPCGFEPVDRSLIAAPSQPYEPSTAPSEITLSESRPLQQVYPVPTSDPGRFDAARGSVASFQQDRPTDAVRRPAPVPLQEPRPITPIPRKILDPVEAEPRPSERAPSRQVLKDTAVTGIAAAAIGLALSSDRKDGQDSRESPRDRDDKPRTNRLDVDARDASDEKHKSLDDWRHPEDPAKKGRASEREIRHRETIVSGPVYEDKRPGESRDGHDYFQERDGRKYGRKDEQKANRREIRRDEQHKEDSAQPVDAGGHKRVEGREKPPRERPIDPFQFQVTDDAFQPPVHATPRRPLTPNVITIDREPNFSPFKPEDDRPPFLERESRRDSYERELRDARRVHEETNHATAPLNAAPLASAAPVIVAEDRGRSHNRGTDSTSRNRSRRSESPTRGEDAVLADANRYYREAELARKAKEEEERRARESAEASVVDKWKEEPTIVDVAPRPETHYPKMTSLYDAPNADVRVDNILEHPNELSRFRVSDYRDLSETPIFQARDPSAERERPMLNIVRPTPTPTPTPRKQQSANEPPPEREEADIDISKAAPDVDPESQMEASPVPSMHKAVTWGKNQTKHYVVESPERGDNPDSGPKVITPATTPRSRSGRKIGWGFLAAALGATSRSGAAAPAVSKSTTDTKVVRTEHPPVDEEKSSSRRTSAEFEENTYENPPVPGPKPPSPRNTQTTGAFAEDPGFTATIAAALKDTGFNPDIVIDDANFHRRDSPHKPTVSVRDSSPRPTVSGRYRSPFAESMVDLGVVGTSGTVPAYNSQTHGSAIDEVSQAPELPAEEDIPSGKSPILSMLTREKSWGPEKAANTRASEDDIISDGVPRRIRGVESAETITTDEGEGASLHKKESKKSKKVVVVQENQWQPEIVEDPRAIVPIHASQDVEDAESAPLEDRQDVLNKGRGIPAGESDSYSPPPILASAPETSGEQPEKYITLGPISELDFEWEFPRRRTQASSQDPEAYGPRTRSAPVSELSMESSYNVVGADVLPVIEEEEPAPNSSEQGSEHDNRHDIPSRPTSASRSSSKDRKLTDPGSTSWAGDEWESKSKSSSVAADSSSYLTTISEVFEAQGRRATDDVSSTFADSIDDRGSLRGLKDVHGDSLTRDSPSRVEHPAGDLVQSRREMVGPLHDLRGEKTTTMEEEPSTLDSLERKAKPDSVVFEGSPSQPAPQSTAPPEASISNPKKHVSYADSPTKPTAISHNGTINSLGKSKKLKRRATLGGFPEDEGVADEKEPPDLVRDETEPLDRNAVSEKLDANRNEDPRRSGSRTRSYTLDDIKSTPSNVDGKDRKNAKSEKDKTSIFDRFRLSIVKQGEEKDRTRKPEEDKNSFLDNADTLGAGVGSAGSDAEHISRESHSSAINVPRKGDVQTTPITPERRPILPQEVELVDPEIVPREIRPAIDPRYGDLLPLPPSRPGSPVPEIGGDFPPLPDSRPETPEYDRIVREKPTHTRRRSTLDSPLRPKTPSQSAIPIQFRLGHRATPSSASSGRYSPVASPIDIHPEFGSGSRTRPRPTSWESSREFKPLLLLQKATRDVTDNLSFSDKGSPSSDKFGSASPHRPGARASDPELSYRSPASPDQDRETRSELSASLMPFTMMEPMGALGDARMVEVGFRPSNDNPLQPPYEFSRERSVETGNASYFSPPPENGGLPLDDGPASLTEQEAARSELPTQKSAENVGWSPQNYELIGPALITPNLDRSLGVPAAEASGDAVLQRPPNLAPAQHITDLAHTVEKFHGNTQIPSVSIGPADRDVLRPETEGLLASGAVPENETAELVDALNTTEEITQNNEPDDLSHPFPETTQGTGVVLEDRLNETGRLPEAPTNIGVPLVQDVATSNDTVSQQVAIDNQDSTDIEKTVSIKRDISIEQGPISQLDVSMAAPAPAVDPEFTNTEKAPSEPEALEVAVQPSSAEPEALEVIAEPPSAEAEFQRALFDSPLTTCEPTVVELETSTVEGGLASTEPAAQEVSIAEPEVATVEGRTSVAEIIPAVEIAPDVAMPETVMAEPELAPIEKEVAVPGKELLAVAPELITDFEIYAVEPSLVATPQEPAGVEERDPVVVGSEKSEEPTPAIESPSSTPKKDGEKSGQQLGLATPLGEPEKSGEDLIPECNNNLTNTDLQFSEPASLVQDQLEAAVSQDPPHVRSSLAEEAYSPSEKSKEENEAERIQSEDSEAKVDIGSAQTFIQEQESAPLSGDQPRRAVQEAETTVQIDNQLSVEAEIDIGEAIAPPPEIGPQLESLPGDQLMKTVSSEEPAQANTETNRDHQEISSGIPSTSETRAVNDDFFESVTPPSTGQGEQIHLAPEPLREEIQLPSDTMQPEETEASTVHEDLHVESQHSEVAPTLTEASSQNLVEQEANGSKGPEQTVVDEPILQPNIPGGESTPGPDHGSIGPRETPLSSTISTYNLQEWSAEKPGPAEEPMALDVGAGEGRLDLPSKPVAENPPELTYQEESADKKSEEEKQQSTSALAESDLAPIDPIATEIPRELIPQPTGLDASPEVSVPTNQQLIEPSVDKETGSADIEDGGENAQPSRIADTEKEPEQSKLEEPLAESPPSAEQLEPTSDILTEVDNSNKIPEESQASREIVNDSVVSDDQDQPLQSATELAEEPSAVIETDVDSKQPIEDLRSFTPSGADPVVGDQLTKGSTEVEASSSDRGATRDQNLDSHQVDPTLDGALQEAVGGSVTKDSTMDQETRRPEPTIDVGTISGGTQMHQPQEETDIVQPTLDKSEEGEKTGNQMLTDTKETLVFPIFAPEFSAEPGAISKEPPQIEKEGSGSGSTSTDTKRHETAQFAEPVEQTPMEMPTEPTGESSSLNTILSPDQESHEIPHQSDAQLELKDNPNNAPSDPDSSKQQPTGPSGPSTQSVETKKQRNGPVDEDTKPAPQDTDTSSLRRDSVSQNGTEISADASVGKPEGQLPAETLPKDDPDTTQQSSDEAVLIERQSTDDQARNETVNVGHPTVRDESLAPSDPKSEEAPPKEANAEDDRSKQRDLVDQPTSSDLHAKPPFPTHDLSPVTAEEEALIEVKKIKEDGKEHESGGQDSLDPTARTERPAEEPTQEPSIEVPPSDHVEPPPTAGRDLTEPDQTTSDVPMPAEPVQLPSQSQEEAPQSPLARKGKKDKKKKKKRASQAQETDTPAVPIEEPPIEQPQPHVHDVSHMPTEASSDLATIQETESQRPRATPTEELSDQPGPSTPDVSQIPTDTPDISTPAVQESEPQPFHAVEVVIPSRDDEREQVEPTTQTDKKENDVPIVEPATETSQGRESSVIGGLTGEEEARQTTNATEHSLLEEESAIGPPEPEEGHSEVVAVPKSKKNKKKKKKRNSQIAQDDVSSAPIQGAPESTSVIQAPIDEANSQEHANTVVGTEQVEADTSTLHQSPQDEDVEKPGPTHDVKAVDNTEVGDAKDQGPQDGQLPTEYTVAPPASDDTTAVALTQQEAIGQTSQEEAATLRPISPGAGALPEMQEMQETEHASEGPTHSEVQPDDAVQREESSKLDSSMQLRPSEAEEPRQAQETLQPEEPTEPAELPAAILGKPELVSPKKSKKKKKKRASQGGSVSMPKSTLPIEGSNSQTALPEQPSEQSYPDGPTQLSESAPEVMPGVEYSIASKDTGNAEDAPTEIRADEGSEQINRVSHIEPAIELETMAPSISCEQAEPPQEPIVERDVEQTSKHKGMESIPTEGADVPGDILPEVTSSEEPKERSQDESAAVLSTGPESEHTFKVEDNPAADEFTSIRMEQSTKLEPESAPEVPQPLTEPENIDSNTQDVKAGLGPVSLISEAETPTLTSVISAEPQPENMQPLTVEAEFPDHLDQGHAVDVSQNAGGHLAEPMDQEKSPIPDIERGLNASPQAETVAKYIIPDTIAGAVTETPQVPADHLIEFPVETSQEDEARAPSAPELSAQEGLDDDDQLQAEKSSTERQQSPASSPRFDLETSLLKESKPESLPATPEKLQEGQEKKMAGNKSDLELLSGTQDSPAQVSPSGDSNQTAITTPTTWELESTATNDEWPKTPTRKPKKNKKRRKAVGTAETAPVNVETPTQEQSSAPGGQDSEIMDISRNRDFIASRDRRIGDIGFLPRLFASKTPFIVDSNQTSSRARQAQHAQADEELMSDVPRDITDYSEPSVLNPPPRTPSPKIRPTISIDLSPAQLSSHVEHDRPFDESPQPGKRLKTETHTLAEEIATSDLLPPVTQQEEPTTTYLEADLTATKQSDDEKSRGNTQDFGSPALKPSPEVTPAPKLEPESSRAEGESAEQKAAPIQTGFTWQRSLIQNMARFAHEAVAAVTESRLKPPPVKKDEAIEDTGPEAIEAVSDADTTGLGVSALAERFDDSKKSEDKNKQMYVDKKTPDMDIMIDDSAPQERSERQAPKEDEGPATNVGDSSAKPTTEARDQAELPPSRTQKAPAPDYEPPHLPVLLESTARDSDVESPIMERDTQLSQPKPPYSRQEDFGPQEGSTSGPMGKSSEMGRLQHTKGPLEGNKALNADGDSLKSPSPLPSAQDYLSPGRASPRVLPPVEEETHEELEKDGRNHDHDTFAETNRDSGVITGSPDPMRRSLAEEPSQRDSGIHLRDVAESMAEKQEERQDKEGMAIRTPQPHDRRLQKPGLGSEMPSLGTPTSSSREEERQNTIDPRKTRSQKEQEIGHRSISESVSRRSTPLAERQLRRTVSNTSISRQRTPEPLSMKFRPESPGIRSGINAPPLRRADRRMSGDLRSLSSNLPNNNNALSEREILPHQTTAPVANEGRVRAKDMTDVYDGYGEGRMGSPRSPTRPQSMRRRHSMQVLELESRVEQLMADNRALIEAKSQAEQSLNQQAVSAITERDAEIESLKASLEWLRKEVSRLTEVNDGLNSANNVLALQHNEKYGRLELQHASAARELEAYRNTKDQYARTLQQKDAEIQGLRAQLETTKEQVRELQRQILATKPPDAEFLRIKDEDHFDHRCQQLCSHVQQWVLRFSKFSDMRACRLTSEINDEKIIDRLDNSILDGSEVDEYLGDRVRRRDIFMSMTMNMIWDFVFTRYLFGMDREQRQKLKSLERLLLDVGPPQAVRQWRAVTLTLLSKRPAFGDQRNQDTEAVVQAILRTLSMILPPPSNLEAQIQSQLRRVVREAVDLSIEMRTQRAEYMMLPPLQPEYDASGELVRTVSFNASLMNERSGGPLSNEEHEAQNAIVRTVLFPLVVKKGDDNGVGDEEIVICPAQVLVAKPRYSTIRMVTPSSDGGGMPLSRGTTPSIQGSQSNVSVSMKDVPLPAPTGPLTPPRDSPRASPRHSPRHAAYLGGGI